MLALRARLLLRVPAAGVPLEATVDGLRRRIPRGQRISDCAVG
jgi:hypothetical protein